MPWGPSVPLVEVRVLRVPPELEAAEAPGGLGEPCTRPYLVEVSVCVIQADRVQAKSGSFPALLWHPWAELPPGEGPGGNLVATVLGPWSQRRDGAGWILPPACLLLGAGTGWLPSSLRRVPAGFCALQGRARRCRAFY